jgi:nicotinic acid phosphoribosyltransferase
VEQSIIGGCAHLINFEGTDTLSAAWYAQFKLNNSKPVGFSIPATEHSIMTSHTTEKEAMTRLLEQFGAGVCACVMDSYDYTNALESVLPSVAKLKLEKGGVLVLRPDSGDPVQVVLEALHAADRTFGSYKNSKGFKVLKGVAVIQGDGLSAGKIAEIATAVRKEGFSAQNVAYGMGGGLLQKVNRDTMSFATKVSFIRYADGKERDVMKMPKGDKGKTSLPGRFAVVRENNVF